MGWEPSVRAAGATSLSSAHSKVRGWVSILCGLAVRLGFFLGDMYIMELFFTAYGGWGWIHYQTRDFCGEVLYHEIDFF